MWLESRPGDAMTQILPDEQPRRSLNDAIAEYVPIGYQVRALTPTSAALVKPKTFDVWLCVLLLGIIYIPFYLAKREETVFIEERNGEVRTSVGPATSGASLNPTLLIVLGAFVLFLFVGFAASMSSGRTSTSTSSSSVKPITPLPFIWSRDMALILDRPAAPADHETITAMCAPGSVPDDKRAAKICLALKGKRNEALKVLDNR